MKLKKGLAVALTATMAFGALTGCSNNGGNNETTAGTVSQAESTPVAEFNIRCRDNKQYNN